MAENSNPPGTAAVTDRRSLPTGAFPRGTQTWLMVGIAAVMLVIMFVAGRPQDSRRQLANAVLAPAAPSPERLRDYQERLRVMESRAAQEAQQATTPTSNQSPVPARDAQSSPSAAQDPIIAERRRREYDSLFASNIVLSRRPESERPDANRREASRVGATAPATPGNPSLDDVADAVVRATTRAGSAAVSSVPSSSGTPNPSSTTDGHSSPQSNASQTSRRTQTLVEGTIIDTVLTNRLDGAIAAPVNCLVTNAVYAPNGQDVLIPAGARILGETKPVQSAGETRLAVSFHRLLLPNGRSHSLDGPPALNQIGDAGLRDQVNQHYVSTFGAAAAVGLISGLAQFVGTAGFSGAGSGRTVVIAGPADSSAQATAQVMSHLLNRPPTITIREGHRVKVYLTKDLELPPYSESAGRED
jgi:type IV secretion system protein TrbI